MSAGGPAANPGAKVYDYAMRYRPPGHATVPDGWIGFLDPMPGHPYGGVRYPRPLQFREIDTFELVPLDPAHPYNVKRDLEAFKDRFMNEFAAAGERWRIGDRYTVTPSTMPGVAWQFTFFQDGVPTGHLDFNDFDELAREVWSAERRLRREAEQSAVEPDSTEQAPAP